MIMKGTAYVFYNTGRYITSVSRELPELEENEVLVSNEMATICTSDLLTISGKRHEPSPLILGHECVGRVQALPKEPIYDLKRTKLSLGDRISWSVFAAPVENEYAKRGMRQKSKGLVKYGHQRLSDTHFFSGAFATHSHLLPDTCLMKLPEKLPLATLAPINCSLATVCGAYRLAGEVRGRQVLISGAGMLGVYACAIACSMQAQRVVVIEPSPKRQNVCLQFGADEVYSPGEIDHYPLESFDIAIDTSGAIPAMQQGLHLLRTGGAAIWVGSVFPQPPLGIDTERIVRKLITIRGLHNYNEADFQEAVRFIENHSGDFPFEQLVEKTFPLTAINEAVDFAQKHKPYRVGLLPHT